MQVQRNNCHTGTFGDQIKLNGNSTWHEFPDPAGIPDPAKAYQYMDYPTISIPASELINGQNKFQFRVDPSNRSGSQHLLFGVVVRMYYDKSKIAEPRGTIACPATISQSVSLSTQVSGSNVTHVDYVYYGEGVNWLGDGIWKNWQYTYFNDKVRFHIGTANTAPYSFQWSTEWLPDQAEPVKVAARVVTSDKMVYMTEAVSGAISRPEYGVELCKPYNIPTGWVTRSGEKGSTTKITGDLSKATGARLSFATWAGKYCQGINVNGKSTGINCSKGNYAYVAHNYLLSADQLRQFFKAGENQISFPKCCTGEHGAEILYPGPTLTVKYGGYSVDSRPPVSRISTSSSENIRIIGNTLHFGSRAIRKVELIAVDGRVIASHNNNGESSLVLQPELPASGLHIVRLYETHGGQISRAIFMP